MPTILPTMAPRQSEGINKPHGTLSKQNEKIQPNNFKYYSLTFMPKVKMVMINFSIKAMISSQIALYTPGPAAAKSMADFTFVKFLL